MFEGSDFLRQSATLTNIEPLELDDALEEVGPFGILLRLSGAVVPFGRPGSPEVPSARGVAGPEKRLTGDRIGDSLSSGSLWLGGMVALIRVL